MKVMVAMSGGVDSSVAAALLVEQGHEVVGATLKLWGGESSSGCCSVADVEDARAVAQRIGIPHHVFSMTESFKENVVEPYVAAHAEGRTPNPCIECNRHIKFDQLLHRAQRLGFERLATGHHARTEGGELLRGADESKDQSYVLSMLTSEQLAVVLFPVGTMDKAAVREHAHRLSLRTADKPDSQDVCFINAGRREFLSTRTELHPGTVVDSESGEELGSVDAVELVTVGQRRGMGGRRYVVSVDVAARRVHVAPRPRIESVDLGRLTWVDASVKPGTELLAQVSAHGKPLGARFDGDSLTFSEPQPPIAPGQTVAFYDGDRVLGAGIVR